ncbi:hypothetical protein Pla144_04910 [Bythopirellula polymerisocia]|uniref:Uncharacterized protein n=2 Tax=Bythopirellula polymerisocia TaxID=2528003 RepID=A0A5C6CYL1_9BACT|nr:hypothetical protein Pla144_04910 [Bythopirellula polymerisocia]
MVLLLALMVILWSGFSYWSEYSDNAARIARERLAPPVGVRCQIVFSGEDLGIERMPPTPAMVNGATNSVTGKIVDQSERWIVLASESTDERSATKIWIPRERVLLIRVDN